MEVPGKLMIMLGCFWLALAGSQAQAQIYKWTDQNGEVHFSDHAPSGQKTTTLDVPEAQSPSSAPAMTEQQQLNREKRVARVLEEDRKAEEDRRAKAAAAKAKKQAYCERFRNRLERLDSANRVYSENQDGTVTYWKDKDADHYKAEQRRKYHQQCESDSD